MGTKPGEDDRLVNIEAAEIGSLADICTLELNPSLHREKRLAYVFEKLKDPLCFRYGQMGIMLEFDDDAPPLQEVLERFLTRKKSGL